MSVPPPSADDFAARRLARHDRSRRWAVVVGVVVVLVGALAAGLLVAYGLGGDEPDDEPRVDDAGRVVPSGALDRAVRDEPGAARALLTEGAWPAGEELDGMPGDDVGRIAWLLTEVAWSDPAAGGLGVGMFEAAEEDDGFLGDLTAAVAADPARLLPAARQHVVGALVPHDASVRAALAGEEPPSGQPVLVRDDLVATFAAVGPDAVMPLEGALVDLMSGGWANAFPAAERDLPGAAGDFRRRYAAVFGSLVEPVVLLHGGVADGACGGTVDAQCRAEVTAWTARADAAFAVAVRDSIPRDLLPDAVDAALGDDAADRRALPPEARRAWERFRVRQGYGVTGPVLDALAG